MNASTRKVHEKLLIKLNFAGLNYGNMTVGNVLIVWH